MVLRKHGKSTLRFYDCADIFLIQRSAVTVTAVTVTIAYSDSFGNPQLALHGGGLPIFLHAALDGDS